MRLAVSFGAKLDLFDCVGSSERVWRVFLRYENTAFLARLIVLFAGEEDLDTAVQNGRAALEPKTETQVSLHKVC